MIRAFHYGRYHGKGIVGSTRLRVMQLMKYWPEYQEYRYGENPDVMVYQKVYLQPDWRFMEHFKGIQILDICDPDWFEQQAIRQTLDCMDGVITPTESLAAFLRQMTDKPVRVIPDRHDVEAAPPLKTHTGALKRAVWFGYSQNIECLRPALTPLQQRGIALTVISNTDPYLKPHGSSELYDYTYQRFDETTILTDLARYDICVLPTGNRPRDVYKSNNRTTLAQLAGLPVVTDVEGLDAMQAPATRQALAKKCYDDVIENYDVKKSVTEMKEFIRELTANRLK